jgi:hypothetical protein
MANESPRAQIYPTTKPATVPNALRTTRSTLLGQRWLGHDFSMANAYRIPESHSHWTFVILPATTSTSNGPKRPIVDFLPFMETL